jgi:hypothetical protein
LTLAAHLAGPYEILDANREIALARSAGLPPWNEEATLYVLGRDGYSRAKEGTNGFSCMVGRSDPGTRWPICFDAVGSETILPRYIREAELRLQGKTAEEVRRDTAQKFLSGEYRAPGRTGVSYMLSKETIASNGKELILVPPHLMIYAPNVRSEEIGAVPNHVHSPMAQFEGDPHGYIIVFVRDTPVDLKRLGSLPR